ncbi:hypothetical protein DTO021D3_4524 [Paecilomyces variotii]|nr:hypothetical protein DTO032I3_3643 [Paecilomyces variotii]KAJ9278615.1 hypothetical protein DTO021D3_4524 [Paecilomyces variotii]KAJ9344589.1 hypothetical protein DTO027B6_2771 [Paecilomyces variotii]KAJ9352867.1 hypothetical protein DTO027B9_5615 [Paecilomyces variotii]KAJ9366927.1 hypothetical protein DTO282E5_8420 [Paecilomyces variotii]
MDQDPRVAHSVPDIPSRYGEFRGCLARVIKQHASDEDVLFAGSEIAPSPQSDQGFRISHAGREEKNEDDSNTNGDHSLDCEGSYSVTASHGEDTSTNKRYGG